MKYTREIIEDAVKNSSSYADVMRKLGIKCTGGNHGHIKGVIAKYGINTSHFLGRRTNCGASHTGGPASKSAREILTLNNPGSITTKAFQLRRALIEIGREYCCAECGLADFWNGKELTLQVDHINGDKHDNRPENLRFLCPNCHSQTQNWGYCNQGGTDQTSRAAYFRGYRKRQKEAVKL
jgi:5-methylcytosine-specific restriction endonuclease McrA